MNNKSFVIGIAGGSGSGKTFFLNCFLNHFNPGDVCLISQDDYYIPVGDLTPEENKLHNFDLPSAIDGKQFLEDIQKILRGEVVYKKEYNFNNKSVIPKTLEIKPAPVIIIEGLFILHFSEISELLNMKIFIDADEDIALQRRITRDFAERGYSYDEVLYKWKNHVLPAYKAYLLPHKSTAHQIIVNNTNEVDDIIKIAQEISRSLKGEE